jgi:V8-like Glu-specific endopeptidase
MKIIIISGILLCLQTISFAGWGVIGGSDDSAKDDFLLSNAQDNNNSLDLDVKLANVADRYSQAVGVVVAVSSKPIPVATAWAFAPNKFATNSHVSESVKKLQKKGLDVFIALNNSDRRLRVVGVKSHPNYGKISRNYDGQKSLGISYDVAILITEETTDHFFPIASEYELKKLKAGYKIGFLGFPMESLASNNINVKHPVATMQTGILTSITDYWQKRSNYKNNVLLKHNLPSAGGASGSPLFNANGKVIGIHNAGNSIEVVVESNGGKNNIKRIKNAAMINFGQRIDLLNDIR